MRPLNATHSLFALLAVWVILCAPWFWAKQTVPFDSKDEFYPTLYFVTQSLRNGELPFWNPYIYGGYPTVSDPQSMTFSPLALLMMLAIDKPSFHWFDAIELFHLLIGGVGTLLVCIRFGYAPIAGLFSAVVYMFGGSAAARMQHVPMIFAYSYFPLALLLLDKALDSNRVRWAICFGVFAGVMAAHQNQVAYLLSLVLIGHAIHKVISADSVSGFLRTRWRVFLAGMTAGAITLAIPLYATLQFLPLTNRARIPLDVALENSLHPVMFLTLFVRNFFDNARPASYWGFGDVTTTFLYAGTLPAVMTIFCGLSSGALFESRFRYFLGVGVAAILYSIGGLTPFYGLLYRVLPGVSLYRRPTDATFVLNLTIALATGFVIDRLLSAKPFHRKSPILLLAISATIGLFVWGISYARAAGKLGAPYLARDVLLALLFIGIAGALIYAIKTCVRMQTRLLWTYTALGLLIADLAVHNAGSRLNAGPEDSAPLLNARTARHDPILLFLEEARRSDEQKLERVEFINAGASWPNASMVFRVQATQGYNPLLYDLYARVIGAQEHFVVARPFTPMTPNYESVLFNLLGVRYIVSFEPPPTLPAQNEHQRFILVRNDAIKAWRNPNVLPRVTTATTIYIEPNLDRAIAAGDLPAIDYGSAVVLEHLPPTLRDMPLVSNVPLTLRGEGSTNASIVAYRNNEVTISARFERDAILVLNDVYYPYWRVYVDGKEKELLQANYLFRGVHVDAGEHTVVFRFEPFSWPALRSTIRRIL